MDNRINILIGSDINYAPYYGVMLTSLFENNKESCFDIYLLTDETWTDTLTEQYEALCKKYTSSLYVYKVNADAFKDYPQTGTIAPSAYYRLEVCRFLPSDIHKILYLDGDMLVIGNIESLWNTDLTGKGIACVVDCQYYNDDIYKRLNLDEKHKNYCNAGVALYNLDYWRQHDIRSKAITYIEEHLDALYWMDQDVINIILSDAKIILPARYNFQTYLYANRNWENYDDKYKTYIKNESHNSIIIHYSSQPKPWSFRYFGAPYYREWELYCSLSLWADCRIYHPIGKYIKFLIKRYIAPSFLKKQIAHEWHIDDNNKQYMWT